jgi:sulfopyruvate decarboxylase TPP-binding subunit
MQGRFLALLRNVSALCSFAIFCKIYMYIAEGFLGREKKKSVSKIPCKSTADKILDKLNHRLSAGRKIKYDNFYF